MYPHHRYARRTCRIVELQLALAKAERALHHDDLTTLLNRRGFQNACDLHSREMPALLSCAMIDLDNFKAVNDARGHIAGDTVLMQVAIALRRGLRPADVVARLGGDEFALLLVGAASMDAEHILTRIQSTLERRACAIKFCAGIAEKDPRESLAQTLARADAALLYAKQQGKSRIVRAVAHPQSAKANRHLPSASAASRVFQ